MTTFKVLSLSLAVMTALSFGGCEKDSSSKEEPTIEKSFDAQSFTQDVDGILSTQTDTVAKAKNFFRNFSFLTQAYAGDIKLGNFKYFWNENISTLSNSDSLMGFLHQNVKPMLSALESADWDYSKSGKGTATVVFDGESIEFSYYSEPIDLENGKGAKIYLGTDKQENYENLDIYSATATGHGYTTLTLKEINNVKTFYWVDLAQYSDRSNSEWNVTTSNTKEYIKYKRESTDSDYKYFPNIHRNKNGISGGRTILYVVDENKKEIYFEHLTSTEKHNRQEHYTIKLTGLEDKNGILRVTNTSNINFSRVAREYFNTAINGQIVNLVNDSNSSQVIYDIAQGSLMEGMKYAHSVNGILDNGCIEFSDDLDYNNASLSEKCTSSITTLPTLTSHFNEYKANPIQNVYLPAAGTTYNTIDLRINMFAIYNDNYDGSWISQLETY